MQLPTLGEESTEKTDINFVVSRLAYSSKEFDSRYRNEEKSLFWKQRLRMAATSVCSKTTWYSRLNNIVPLVTVLRTDYALSDLISDVIAGLTMCVFLIPQGLAYGLLAGLQPVNGLYTSLVPPFVFAIFGMSRHLSMGTFALVSIMMSDLIDSHRSYYLSYSNVTCNNLSANSIPCVANQSEADAANSIRVHVHLQVALVVTFVSAVINILMGTFHLGIIMRYMSNSMLKGFTTAAAVHIFTSQVPLMLGVQPIKQKSAFKLLSTYISIFKVISNINWATVLTSSICMVLLYSTKEFISPRFKKKFRLPLPAELILIIITLIISYFADLKHKFGVSVVGTIPQGLPQPVVPDFAFIPSVLADCVSFSVVGSVLSLSIVKHYCLQFNKEVDYNHELIALGLCNVVGSFFQCFYSSGALARNAVVVEAGMKSQLASIISCLGMLLFLFFVGPIFEYVPKCVLGVIIAVALKTMFKQVLEVPSLWKLSKIDGIVWIVTAVSVLVLDITLGLIIGFAFTILSVSLQIQTPPVHVYGRIGDSDIYKNMADYSSAKEVPGIKIIHFDGPIYFANADVYRDVCLSLTSKHNNVFKTVIVDSSAWVFVDAVGIGAVVEVHNQLNSRGLTVIYAGLSHEVSTALKMSAKSKVIEETDFYLSVHDAVLNILHKTEEESSQPVETSNLNNTLHVESSVVEIKFRTDSNLSSDSEPSHLLLPK